MRLLDLLKRPVVEVSHDLYWLFRGYFFVQPPPTGYLTAFRRRPRHGTFPWTPHASVRRHRRAPHLSPHTRWRVPPPWLTPANCPRHPRVTLRWLKKHDLENHRRVWLCGFVALDGVPFALLQRGGRDGDDEFTLRVFDATGYVNAARLLLDRDTIRVPALVGVAWDVPDAGDFYGLSLDDDFTAEEHADHPIWW